MKDSWEGLAKGTGERLTNPIGSAIRDVKDALDSPSAAYYLGEKSADAAVTAPGLIFGGEGAPARAGLVDDFAGSGAIPRELIDHPGPTIEHPAPLGGADHPAPSFGDGYDVKSPESLALDRGPEFTLNNPVAHMSPELLQLSEAHLTDSGTTVLGPYRPADGGPSYIQVANQNGASYFDIGDAWDSATPTERLAANQHVLDMAIKNNDTITMSVPFRKIEAETFTAAEILYLEARGYRRKGDNTLIPPE